MQYLNQRRFPPPWSVEELKTCFVVKDKAGQKLAYIYFEDEPGRLNCARGTKRDGLRRGSSTRKSCNSAV
jgi:hypothetical protein